MRPFVTPEGVRGWGIDLTVGLDNDEIEGARHYPRRLALAAFYRSRVDPFDPLLMQPV